MSYQKPLPKPNADTQPFWDGCCEHKLRFQKCKACGHIRWPAGVVCPRCHSQEAEWVESSGKGKAYSFAVFHTVYEPSFARDVPYVVAIIELEDGPHFLSNIVGCPPGEVRCDMPLELVWEDVTPEFSLPKFRPVK
jgi:uncharacterized OB-fold protein